MSETKCGCKAKEAETGEAWASLTTSLVRQAPGLVRDCLKKQGECPQKDTQDCPLASTCVNTHAWLSLYMHLNMLTHIHINQKPKNWAVQFAQWLKALVHLPEDPDLIPAPTWQLITSSR